MARASKAGTAKSGTTKKSGTAKKSGAAKKSAAQEGAQSGGAAKKAVKKSTKKAAAKTPAKTPATKAAESRSTASKATSKATRTASTGRSKKVKSPFDSRFLEQMRKLLNTERDTYSRQATNLKAEADSLVADLDPGDVQFDEESGEGDTIAVERGRDLALAAKALEMIDEIDHALSKFDDGSYGICEVSGEPIPKERLEAIPWAREKVEFKVGGFGRR